jgi:dephospho-CoA kinase
MTDEEARRRVAAQLPLSDKIAVADYVIRNDGSLDDLRDATLDVHRRILERFDLAQHRNGDA